MMCLALREWSAYHSVLGLGHSLARRLRPRIASGALQLRTLQNPRLEL